MKKAIKNNFVLLLFFAAAIIVAVVAIVSSRMMTDSAHMIEESAKQQLVALSRAAALLVTADEMDEYIVPEDMAKQGYIDLKMKVIEFNTTSDSAYTYFLRLDTQTNMMQFIIDNIEDDYTGLAADQVDREPTPDIALTGTATAVPLGSYSTGWDGYISAFAPVYYKDGRLSNVLAGVDMEDRYIKQAYDQNVLFSYILISAVVLVIAICLVCIMLYRRQARKSQMASISKSTFLSNMSHEMRTPMNAIIGMTEIAKATGDQERIKYCLDKIDNAAGHLLGVINDILDISKIESGKFTLSTDVWTFDVLMQRVANVINFKVDEKHQNFTINVDDDVPAALNADQQRLAQILTNLLSNAVRFTANGGRIGLHVSMIEQNDTQCTLQFAVKDNGIGIPAEKQASIFQSFEQADTSISRRFGGTGLGLAICKSIIEAMKGNIWVESEEGKGSTFFFTVQVGKVLSDYTDDADDDADSAGKGADSTTTSDGADGSDHGTEKEHVHEQAHEHKHSESLYGSEALKGIFAGRCVLLAEDMEINSEILAALLADTGVVLDFAWDGNQAYDMFASQPDKYDLIMMDINMPNMDGYGATQAIRSLQGEKAATIPIIAMTANVFREDIEKCLEVGMDDHIGKPVELEDVVNKLRKYMH